MLINEENKLMLDLREIEYDFSEQFAYLFKIIVDQPETFLYFLDFHNHTIYEKTGKLFFVGFYKAVKKRLDTFLNNENVLNGDDDLKNYCNELQNKLKTINESIIALEEFAYKQKKSDIKEFNSLKDVSRFGYGWWLDEY